MRDGAGWTGWGRRMAGVAGALAGPVMAGALLAGCGPSAEEPARPAPTSPATGFTDFRKSNPEWLTQQHRTGRLSYPVSPPVGGDHSPAWQSCNGTVYDAPIASEHAVHSLEHGAVWITYRPDLPADQVEVLATKVRDRPYMFMSPYPGLDVAVSLQAWGYQLRVDSAADERIDEFIKNYRESATMEPGATCSRGITTTGTKPVDPPSG